MPAKPSSVIAAFLAACLGIALYSVMDAVMKGLALAVGAYDA
jgi:S-adenosylmethionine uptake transporter